MKLRPFFSYYGSKWRSVPRYPAPHFRQIIEPFAGSAGYSLHYPDHDVLLVDAYPVVADLWAWLIRVSEKDVAELPDLAPGQSVRDLDLPSEARSLIGFWLNPASASPCNTLSKWALDESRKPGWSNPSIRRRVVQQVAAIRHWRALHGSYEDCPDVEATWFIDPPYLDRGRNYKHGSASIEYERLAAWCRSRRGQVIVCENEGATWLPFRPLFSNLSAPGTHRRRPRAMEVIWTNDP